MTRRGFLGTLLGAALAPKTMLAPAAPAFVGGCLEVTRVRRGVYSVDLKSAYPQTVFHPERIVMKLQVNSLYGKFAT